MFSTIIRIGIVAMLNLNLLTVSFAQSPPRKKKEIKDFGSSLKRLKENPQKDGAVALTNPRGEEVSEEDVIRIDTSLVTFDLLVLDERGKNVAGLTANDFVIAEDGQSQTVSR